MLASLTLGFNLAAAAPEASDAETADTGDKSGTNPLNFQNTLGFKNEFNRIGDHYANFTKINYSQPLASNLKVGLDLPLLATDGAGKEKFGLSDISIKSTWIPYATKKMGLALGADVTMPTASDDLLGSEKWQVGPSVTVAFFLPNNLIFAPAYKHGVSFAGESSRADINSGALDFYLVWKFDRNRQWFTFDPTILMDYENDRYESATVRLTYGRVLTKVGNGALSGYIRPGIGIGQDRPNDWSIEAGVTLIGF